MAEWDSVMTRALAFLLTVVVAAAVTSTPAVACASTPAVGERGHGCCGERTIASAPVGPCCFLSQPVRDRAVTSSGSLAAKHYSEALGSVSQGMWVARSDRRLLQLAGSASPPSSRTVPIYIQQSSLLI